MGVIKGSFQKHLKAGGGQRQKLFVGGGGLKVSPPLPPKKILSYTSPYHRLQGENIFQISHSREATQAGLCNVFSQYSK